MLNAKPPEWREEWGLKRTADDCVKSLSDGKPLDEIKHTFIGFLSEYCALEGLRFERYWKLAELYKDLDYVLHLKYYERAIHHYSGMRSAFLMESQVDPDCEYVPFTRKYPIRHDPELRSTAQFKRVKDKWFKKSDPLSKDFNFEFKYWLAGIYPSWDNPDFEKFTFRNNTLEVIK